MTKQNYTELVQLYAELESKGFQILAFPSNEFGGQDPGTNAEIAGFCRARFGVSFPMMATIEVNGAQAHPLWTWLRRQAPGAWPEGRIEWNFTKFLVARDGVTVRRFEPSRSPDALKSDIEAALAAVA